MQIDPEILPTEDLMIGRVDLNGIETLAPAPGLLVRPAYSYRSDLPRRPIKVALIGFDWWHECSDNASWVEVHHPDTVQACPVCGHPGPSEDDLLVAGIGLTE